MQSKIDSKLESPQSEPSNQILQGQPRNISEQLASPLFSGSQNRSNLFFKLIIIKVGSERSEPMIQKIN